MKKLTLLMACCIAISLNSTYAQSQNEKKYRYLRDYKAPDFKQRRFDLGFSLYGNSTYGTDKPKRFSENSDFRYSQYSNSAKYQGDLRLGLSTYVNSFKIDDYRDLNMHFEINVNTENRFFFNKEWFVGVHSRNIFGYFGYKSTNDYVSQLSLMTLPAISIGNGRMEPVSYARNAMDIEKSLSKGNRLGVVYTTSQLNTIADELARINNVRFYDFRLRRIEQFEQLDRIMKEVGGVSEFDMAYFSYLADAYLYAQNFSRFSGFRSELGISNRTRLDLTIESGALIQTYNLMAFANVIYDLPKSYGVQHTFSAGAASGPQLLENNGIATSIFPTWVSGDYRLGLFPTTRTNINFGVRAGMYYEEEVGLGAGLYTNGSVYLSPQFRLSFNGSVNLGSNYINDPLGGLIPLVFAPSNLLNISGGITLNYAIF